MTDGELSEYRERARSWLRAHFRPAGAAGVRRRSRLGPGELDEQRALQAQLHEAGYAGISWPSRFGGQGLTEGHELAFAEEAQAFALPDLGIAGHTTFGVCAPTMLAHAAAPFLERHVPRILAGAELWVQLFSEPEAGSDLAGVRTTARRDGDTWVLSGSKVWTSGAFGADYGMCLARTDWDVPKHRGLTWFAVRLDAPGVTVTPITEITGEAEFCQEFFDDVRLPADEVIGEVDGGWGVAQTVLQLERSGRNDGVRTYADDQPIAPDLVEVAQRHGRLDDPTARQRIAHAEINDFAVHQLNERVAQLLAAGDPRGPSLASYCKLAAGLWEPERARIGMALAGSRAVAWDEGDGHAESLVAQHLNGRIMAIAGGSNEMQRNVIGERVLGLPREPSFDTDRPFREVVRDAARWSRRSTPEGGS